MVETVLYLTFPWVLLPTKGERVTHKAMQFSIAKMKNVQAPIEAVIVGRTWTTRKLKSQLHMVLTALA